MEQRLADALADLDAVRGALLRRLCHLPDAALDPAWPWQGRPADLGTRLVQLSDRDQATLVEVRLALAAHGHRPAEAHLCLAAAELERGWLLAELVGVDHALLDRRPAPDPQLARPQPIAPSLRQCLGHLIHVERGNAARIVWDVACGATGYGEPIEPPAGSLPAAGPDEAAGSLDSILDRLAAVRRESVAALLGLAPADLAAPTTWDGSRVEVRFRLHRLASQERTHTIQVRRTLAAVGHQPTAVQQLLGRAQVTRASLRAALVGVPESMAATRVGAARAVSEALRALAEAERDGLADLDWPESRAAS